MGATKTEHFTHRQNEIANVMKALGHPARVAIIDYLLSVDSCICGDIVNELPLAQPTVSQHLKELKNAGLIKGNIEGNSICYCIDDATFSKFNQLLSDYNNHTHNVPYSWTGDPGSSNATAAKPSASSALSTNKGKASDGSIVTDKATSEIVLSKRPKVR